MKLLQDTKKWLNEPITPKRFLGMFVIVGVFIALVQFDIIPSATEVFPEFYEWLGLI